MTSKKKDRKPDQIVEILAAFPFERVHKAMEAVGWCYYLHGERVLPTVNDLRDAARELLELASKGPVGSGYSTGGFHVEKFKLIRGQVPRGCDYRLTRLRLSFVLDEQEST